MSSDRDWDRELAKIDKQLGKLSDDDLLPHVAPTPASRSGAAGRTAQRDPGAMPGAVRGDAVAGTAKPAKPPSKVGAYFRLGLSMALGASLLFFPYESRCGVGLFGYLGAAALVAGTGMWSAVFTWKLRLSAAHVASLVMVSFGLVLASAQILPRVGYAFPSEQHPAIWLCQ